MIKKILSLLLSATMLMGISTTAFAAESQNSTTYGMDDLSSLSAETQENIILVDENDNVLFEFHTDGYSAEFVYLSLLSENQTPVLTTIVGNDGTSQAFSYDSEGKISKIDYYSNDNLLGTKDYTEKTDASPENMPVPYAAYSAFYVYHSDGTKSAMNNLISDAKFVRQSTSASQANIQKLFTDNNSPLKNSITIYKKNSSNQVYSTGTTVTPAKVIYDASVTHGISPKVILTTLQKESSLVSSYHTSQGTALSARSFWFCMGAGSDSSTSTTGFSGQIDEGAKILKKWYDDGANYSFPYNYSHTGFRGYQGYNTSGYLTNIWCDNKATYSLYKYTPYTCADNTSTKTANVMFMNIYKMSMFKDFPE